MVKEFTVVQLVSSMQRKLSIKNRNNIRVDIGCGRNYGSDVIGMDSQDFGQEIVWDVREGLPFEDSSVSFVRMVHFLEHLSYAELPDFFYELRRVCKNGAILSIIVPHGNTVEGYSPGHLSFWTKQSFTGIVEGYNRGGTIWFRIEEMKRRGFELIARIRVVK